MTGYYLLLLLIFLIISAFVYSKITEGFFQDEQKGSNSNYYMR